MNYLNFKKSTGITLISLVITVILILILAGVAISISLNENHVFDKAKQSSQKTKLAQLKELVDIIKGDLVLSAHGTQKILTQDDLVKAIKSDNNFSDCTTSIYDDRNIVITTADKLFDVVIKKDLNIDVFEHSSLLQGTWLFNNTITYPSDLYFEFDGNFFNDDYSFPIYSIQCNEKLGYNCFFPWYWISENPHHPFSFGYLPENEIGFPQGWVWINIDTYDVSLVNTVKLNITSDISEVVDINGNPAGKQLLEWLQLNAVKQ